jgi:transposase-like protein
MNTNVYSQNLSIMLAAHGSYSRVARALGVSPAHLYRAKPAPNQKLTKHIACKARVLRLRQFISILRERQLIPEHELQACMLLALKRVSSK